MMNNRTYNNQLQPNAISPSAFTNQNTIQEVFGQANPGTFTRSIGNAAIDQNLMDDAGATAYGMGNAQQPPYGVQIPVTPTYDLNNQ
jgi:hypothetical protein